MIYHKRKFLSYVYIVEGTDAAFKAIFTWRVMYFVGAINILVHLSHAYKFSAFSYDHYAETRS